MADTSYTPNESAELPLVWRQNRPFWVQSCWIPACCPVVLETIRPESFFNEQHKELFQIIFQMFTSGEKADVITVLNAAVERKVFETAAEGRNYLAALVNIVPSVSNIERYCEIVAEKYYIRCLAYAARGILQDIQSGEESAQTLMDAAEQRIFDIRQGRDVQGLAKIGDAICEAYDRIGKIAGPGQGKVSGRKDWIHLSGHHYLRSEQVGLAADRSPSGYGKDLFCTEHRHQRGTAWG